MMMMQDKDKKEFAKRLANVFSFYEKNLTMDIAAAWFEILRGQDFEAVCGAFNRHVADPERGMWMPKPADIMALVHGKGSDAAEIAWGKLYRAIGRVGRNSDVVFDDALIHAVVEDMGGWIKICEVDGDKEVSFMRVQFIKAYQAYRSRGVLPEYPRALTGISNLHNAANGFRLARPIGVGDAEKVRLVFEGGGAGGSLKVFGISDAVLSLSGKKSLMLE
jgi:hypothetical protein